MADITESSSLPNQDLLRISDMRGSSPSVQTRSRRRATEAPVRQSGSAAQRDYFKWFAPWGVPYGKSDIKLAASELYSAYINAGCTSHEAMEKLMRLNEMVVSRCGMLMHFSALLIALFLFIAYNPHFVTLNGHKVLFYSAMSLWVSSTVALLWSLKHKLPPLSHFADEYDFHFTARLYYRRMGIYNIALVIAVFCYVCVILLLSPVHLDMFISDGIFSAPVTAPPK